MKHHNNYPTVLKLVSANIPVLLTGEAGSGKTTLAKQIADEIGLTFHSLSMTRQTTLSHILGFISVNGTYIPSTFRKCFDEEGEGGLMLLDEIDASDPNVILCLNTIENGYIAFPDGLVKCHPNFRLMATSNPQDQHSQYTGRAKLDASTLDRYDTVDIDRDDNLESSLVSMDTYNRMNLLRVILSKTNSSKTISMRDSIRYQQRNDLSILEPSFIYRLTGKSDIVFEQYMKNVDAIPKYQNQSECNTFEELVELLELRNKDNFRTTVKLRGKGDSNNSTYVQDEINTSNTP